MATPVKIGLYGGTGGFGKDIYDSQLPMTLDTIEMWSTTDGPSALITGICFTYTDTNGHQHTVTTWGTEDDKYNHHKLDVDEDDYVIKIEGSIGKAPAPFDGDLGITSLTLITKTGKKLKAGNPNVGSTPFSVILETAGIFAFFAKADTYLNAVGFYAQEPYNPNP